MAVLSARLPGLVPHLLESAAPTRSPPGSSALTRRLYQFGRQRRAAVLKAVGALFAAGITVAAAFAGMPGQVHGPAVSPSNAQPVNVNTTLFYPYLVSPNLYPAPANFTLSNFSQPQLASTVVGGMPAFFLLSTGSIAGGLPDLYLQEGYYEPSLARGLLNQTHCPPGHGHGKGGSSCSGVVPSVPLQWSLASSLPGFRNATLQGDAIAVNNSTVVVAASTAGNTSVLVSTNAGENWSLLGNFPGTLPRLTFSGNRLLLTTNVSVGTDVTSTSLNDSFPATTVLLGGAEHAVPLLSCPT